MSRALTAVVLVSLVSPARSEVRGTLESGTEFDSNIHRFEDSEDPNRPVVGDLLLRGAVRFAAVKRGTPTVSGQGLFAGKLFLSDEGPSENVLISAFGGQLVGPIEGLGRLGLAGNLYDTRHFGDQVTVEPRTFTSAGVRAFFELPGPDGHRARVLLTGGLFDYHPNVQFNWKGIGVGAEYVGRIWFGDPDEDPDASSLDLSARAVAEARDFNGEVIQNGCDPADFDDALCFLPTEAGRVDTNLRFSLLAELVTDRIYGARYDLVLNRSNSFGQSFARHRGELSLSTHLAATLQATVKATVLYNQFHDPLLLSQDVLSRTFVALDDENRNGLSVSLSKQTSERLSLEGRFAYYTNEFATKNTRFQRFTAYFGVVYGWGTRSSL